MSDDMYPVSVEGELRQIPSRGLWMIKWLLLIPHMIVALPLGMIFVILTVIAWFAILFTGKYPRGMFDFNVGVLRWFWRISFYGYSALATDMYPPFSLKEMKDFPADLDVEYPENLSRGLIFVKWLLAIPHFALLTTMVVIADKTPMGDSEALGLLWILVAIVAVVLLFTKKYIKDIFRIVLGINRWCYRVIAYVALMTDKYPPFKLD